MIKNNSILAVIPARGGSKRLPQKNILQLAGKPLIAWTIEEALKVSFLDKIIVSTDNDQIANIAEAYGADVPFMRPSKLAMDGTPGDKVVLHALSKFPQYDYVLLLQPTSSFRTFEDINGIIKFCLLKKAFSVVSVSKVSQHPNWMYKKTKNGYLEPFLEHKLITMSQNLYPLWALNGALYISKSNWLIKTKSFINKNTLGYEIPNDHSLDIDTKDDWELAKYLISRK